jgi:hypothetical protein
MIRIWPISARSILPLAAAMAMLAGCHGRERTEDLMLGSITDIGRSAQGHRWERDRVIEVATSGPVVVDVDAFAGNVTVVGDARVKETRIWVERAAVHGFGRFAEAGDALRSIDYTVSLERGPSGEEIVVVRSETESAETRMVRSNIRVTTPELDSVQIRTTRGDVVVLNNRGPVDIVTSHGDVRVATPWPMREPIRIMNTDGSVEYRVRAESAGLYDLAAVGGRVRQRSDHGRWMKVGLESGVDRMLATLDGGDNPVVIRTSDGDISVAVVADPLGAGAFLSGR